MSAAFGTGAVLTFPRDLLVEHVSRVDVWALHRSGERPGGCQAGGPSLGEISGNFGISWDRPMDRCWRPWWTCPSCQGRARYLYAPNWLCRRCAKLEYLSQHGKLGQARIVWFHKRLDASPHPLDPLPSRPAHHRRFHRLAAQIEAAESRLIASFASISHDLERRAKSERWKRRFGKAAG